MAKELTLEMMRKAFESLGEDEETIELAIKELNEDEELAAFFDALVDVAHNDGNDYTWQEGYDTGWNDAYVDMAEEQ